MWDTVQTNDVHLSHDLQCPRCGHAVHTYLPCGTDCACERVDMPGVYATAWALGTESEAAESPIADPQRP